MLFAEKYNIFKIQFSNVFCFLIFFSMFQKNKSPVNKVICCKYCVFLPNCFCFQGTPSAYSLDSTEDIILCKRTFVVVTVDYHAILKNLSKLKGKYGSLIGKYSLQWNRR